VQEDGENRRYVAGSKGGPVGTAGDKQHQNEGLSTARLELLEWSNEAW
jgi:hypothetical protein